jgi:drug/metabolite transporter (DMT)-like permease
MVSPASKCGAQCQLDAGAAGPPCRRSNILRPSNPPLAILLLLAAIFLISLVDTTCKYYTAELHAVELVWGYFIGILLTLTGYFVLRGESLRGLLATGRPVLQWARPGFLVVSISTLFVGLKYLPIADATAIGFMAPLFITGLSVPLLKEKVGPHRWAAVIIGLAGVIVIVRPGGGIWHWAAVMPLLGALFFAIYQLTTRMLASSERTHTTLFYTGLGGAVWTSLIVPFVWITPKPEHWVAFLVTGVMGALAHLCMVRGFELAQASLLAPFNYSKLIWVTILGYVVFNDVPTANTLIGGAIIIAAGCYVFYRESHPPAVVSR